MLIYRIMPHCVISIAQTHKKKMRSTIAKEAIPSNDKVSLSEVFPIQM